LTSASLNTVRIHIAKLSCTSQGPSSRRTAIAQPIYSSLHQNKKIGQAKHRNCHSALIRIFQKRSLQSRQVSGISISARARDWPSCLICRSFIWSSSGRWHTTAPVKRLKALPKRPPLSSMDQAITLGEPGSSSMTKTFWDTRQTLSFLILC
jgi:hypothetical protein